MIFWWLVDKVKQNQFRIFWAPLNVNLACYLSGEKHPASHHVNVRPIYLYIHGKIPSLLQNCNKIIATRNISKHRT